MLQLRTAVQPCPWDAKELETLRASSNIPKRTIRLSSVLGGFLSLSDPAALAGNGVALVSPTL